MNRPKFASKKDYGSRFADAHFWKPYVEEVCKRHGLDSTAGIRSALPGTHPVFLVGDRWVVKFFSDMFDGARSFAIEREAYTLLKQAPDIPAARFVGGGTLFPEDNGWEWPYLISMQLPGQSLSEVYDQVSFTERKAIAQTLGRMMQGLHSISLNTCSVLRPDWGPFRDWLSMQRANCVANHLRWQNLPNRLIDQLDDYIPDIDALLDCTRSPLLLHCDLNADHLLGNLHNGCWVGSGIIDFGDARVGDLHYELVALHLGLFRCDTRLLRACLQAYGSNTDLQPEFIARAMSFTLLHECNVLEFFTGLTTLPDHVTTLADLAEQIWRPNSLPC